MLTQILMSCKFSHLKIWGNNCVNFRQLKDVVIVFFFTAFCVAAGTALGTLVVAHRKKSPHFVWPRLVFVTGVLIICGILFILLFLYFSGAASGMNNFIINVIEVSRCFLHFLLYPQRNYFPFFIFGPWKNNNKKIESRCTLCLAHFFFFEIVNTYMQEV